MGIGIWSMHYMGMEAFRLPVLVRYDWPTVVLSMAAAILASAVALFVVTQSTPHHAGAVVGSILMGGGIASMHYIGMHAMRLTAMCVYSGGIVALSVRPRHHHFVYRYSSYVRGSGADAHLELAEGCATRLLMGLAIPVVHYVAMAGGNFYPRSPGGHPI